jgi:rhamnulokinase
LSYSLAIDIGASSGRHILGKIEKGKITYEEVYRFENNIKQEGDSLTWDIKRLTEEVIEGIKKCGEIGKIPETVAIDTWGVDYVLLDKNKKEILPAFCYRDSRTFAAVDEVEKILGKGYLYSRTGIQKNQINTVYQLYCDAKSSKLKDAEHFLMMPDYLSYRLTGEIRNEYTNASTTNLINAKTKTWDNEVLDKLGIKSSIFKEPSLPGEKIGNFTEEIKEKVGFDAEVIFCPSHDTASAVAACPLSDHGLYISSGTWSLIGTEQSEPILSADSEAANFTNEGGIQYRYRYLKNIMGMWLFQNIRANLNKIYSYDEMMNMARGSEYSKNIDTNAKEFVAPENMIEAIRSYLGEPELPIGDVLSSVYHSLAQSYADAVGVVERMTKRQVSSIHIVGGGSKDAYLNELTAKYTGKPVFAGPVEATALGNLIVQFMFKEKKLTLEKARESVKNTFDIQEVTL